MASEVLKLATFRGDASSVQALLTVASGKLQQFYQLRFAKLAVLLKLLIY